MSEEELLVAVPRRFPRWMLAVAVVLAAALGGWLLTRGGADNARQPPGAAPTATPIATVREPSLPFQAGESMHDQLLVYVYERAHDPAPAQDFVRTDTSSMACALVPPGQVPERRLARYVRDSFSRMHVLDVARIIDKFAGLCVLELRARDDTGSVLVVRIIAPQTGEPSGPARFDQAAVSAQGNYTRYVQSTSRNGWTVLAGVSGPTDSGPSQQSLATISRARSLRW